MQTGKVGSYSYIRRSGVQYAQAVPDNVEMRMHMGIFEKQDTDFLVKALLSVEDEVACRLFLEDLLTAKEIEDAAQRLQVAKRLLDKENYTVISAQTGASSATISRVNRCVVYGAGGYEMVLKKLR